MNRLLAALIAGFAVAAAATAGARNGPQHPREAVWYGALRKPRYTPPGPIVGVVWTSLELLLAASGYRLLNSPATPARKVAITAWSATLAGLAAYPYLFFGRKRLTAATVVSGAMLTSAASLATAGSKTDKSTGAMVAPLVVWLGLATWLSVDLRRRNRLLSRD